MENIEVNLFMLYYIWIPLFGFAFGGAMAIGFILGIRSERKADKERREWNKAFALLNQIHKEEEKK